MIISLFMEETPLCAGGDHPAIDAGDQPCRRESGAEPRGEREQQMLDQESHPVPRFNS
jgi:hypothetical protein